MRLFLVCLLIGLPVAASAQAGIYGRDQFPHFRGISGLAGGGYGVDWRGYPSLSGPTAFSTPIAHTLGHDRFWLTGSIVSDHGLPEIENNRTTDVLAGTFGHTFGSFNAAISDMLLSEILDQAPNFQIQYVPPRESRIIGSVGVQDWTGAAGSSGDGQPGDSRSSRSFFGVLTARLSDGRNPIYASAGGGTRRFQNGFVNVSGLLAPPIRGWAEWDGFGVNFGLTYGREYRVSGKPVQLSVLAGFVKGKYFTFGGGIGF